MAVALYNRSAAATTTGATSISITYSTNLVNYFILLKVVSLTDISTPTGFTLGESATYGSLRAYVFFRYVPSGGLSGSVTVATTGASSWISAFMETYSGGLTAAENSGVPWFQPANVGIGSLPSGNSGPISTNIHADNGGMLSFVQARDASQSTSTVASTGFTLGGQGSANAAGASLSLLVANRPITSTGDGTATATKVTAQNALFIAIALPATGTTAPSTERTGTAASTLSPVAQNAAGANTVPDFSGVASTGLAPIAQSGAGVTGSAGTSGSAVTVLGSISQTAAGGRTLPNFAGPGVTSLTPVGQSALGTLTPPAFTGSGASVLTGFTQSGSGSYFAPGVLGVASTTLAPMAQSATGVRTIPAFAGAGTSTLNPIGQTALGVHSPPAFTGTAASTLTSVGQSAAGLSYAPGSIGPAVSVLGGVTQASSGVVALPSYTGGSVSTLPLLLQVAVGVHVRPAVKPVPTRRDLLVAGTPRTASGGIHAAVGRPGSRSLSGGTSRKAGGGIYRPLTPPEES